MAAVACCGPNFFVQQFVSTSVAAMRSIHCPNCGQQQASRETMFCSQCGLPLTGIRLVLDNGGAVPVIERTRSAKLFNKKNGVVFSLSWFILFSMFLTAILGILRAPDELIAIVATTGFFGSVLSLIGSLVFLPSSKTSTQTVSTQQPPRNVPPQITQPSAGPALPPQNASSSVSYAPMAGMWLDTNELTPADNSEGKTKMLSDEETRQ